MEQAILVLDGIAEGKTKFISTAKEIGFWVWNINHRNVLSMLTRSLGWEGIKNKQYYDFLDDFNTIANKHFDFENSYISEMVDKFIVSDKANLLVIHNCDKNIAKYLQEKYDNCYNIIIGDSSEENCEYCKTLDYKDINYRDNIINTLNIITNKIGEMIET
jgi:hypothetical protein